MHTVSSPYFPIFLLEYTVHTLFLTVSRKETHTYIHIVQTVLLFLAHAKLPFQFKDHAFITTVLLTDCPFYTFLKVLLRLIIIFQTQ